MMGKLSRRQFIGFFSIGSVFSIWPLSIFSEDSLGQRGLKIKKIIKLLKKKRNSIKTLSFSIFQRIVYVDPAITSKNEIPEKIKMEFCWKPDNLKLIRYIPTEATPTGYGAKYTTIHNNKKEYQKIEALDGSFKNEFYSRWLSLKELEEDQFFALEALMPMPRDNFMTLSGKEFIDGEMTYVVIQGNRKYWISLEKKSVVKVEFYRTSNKILGTVEYKNFEEVYPEILLPTLIISKQFNEDNKLLRKFKKEISDIRINEWMSEETFNVE